MKQNSQSIKEREKKKSKRRKMRREEHGDYRFDNAPRAIEDAVRGVHKQCCVYLLKYTTRRRRVRVYQPTRRAAPCATHNKTIDANLAA